MNLSIPGVVEEWFASRFPALDCHSDHPWRLNLVLVEASLCCCVRLFFVGSRLARVLPVTMLVMKSPFRGRVDARRERLERFLVGIHPLQAKIRRRPGLRRTHRRRHSDWWAAEARRCSSRVP